MALAHLGESQTIADVDTDQTAVARAFRTFYVPSRDWLLQQTPWGFATRYFNLLGQTGLGTVAVSSGTATFSTSQTDYLVAGDTFTVGTTTYTVTSGSGTSYVVTGADVSSSAFTIIKAVTSNPTDDWEYAYRLPTVAWYVRRLVDGNRQPVRSDRPVYRMGHDGTYRLLYTDLSDPVTVEYTARVTDTTIFSPIFDEALAAFLAFKVAPLVTKGDPSGLGLRALQVARQFIGDAAAADANENVMDDESVSDFLLYRNGGGSLGLQRNVRSGL